MKRVMIAAAAVCALITGPAAAQIFQGGGVLTHSTVSAPGTYVSQTISSPYSFFVALDPAVVRADGSFAASLRVTNSTIGESGQFFFGEGSLTKITDTEYQLSAASDAGSSFETIAAHLVLGSPLSSIPGPASILPTSTIDIGLRFRDYTGSITTLTTAVPEPATWLLTILGIGIVGSALRRRPQTFSKARLA